MSTFYKFKKYIYYEGFKCFVALFQKGYNILFYESMYDPFLSEASKIKSYLTDIVP